MLILIINYYSYKLLLEYFIQKIIVRWKFIFIAKINWSEMLIPAAGGGDQQFQELSLPESVPPVTNSHMHVRSAQNRQLNDSATKKKRRREREGKREKGGRLYPGLIGLASDEC
jgi:hypothetical protein